MITYKDSGVDKEEGYKSIEKIKDKVAKTHSKNVLNNLGSFAALYELGKYNNPVLVSGTDGVGTKLKVAFEMGKYDTVGIDCVAMCVNDILCQGAKPLFFLDYLACGKLESDVFAKMLDGVVEGCTQANMSLVGGETAEMPGFYQMGDYDIAGFAVGVVEKDNIIDGSAILENNVVIGIASTGVHSNGFSLVRKAITDFNEDFEGEKIGYKLLTPTKIYVPTILKLLETFTVNEMAHITDGGLIENNPRIIPEGLVANIDKSKIEIPSIFNYIKSKGVPEDEMWGTFNMGIGFVVVVNKEDEEAVLSKLQEMNEKAYTIGYIGKTSGGDSKICLK